MKCTSAVERRGRKISPTKMSKTKWYKNPLTTYDEMWYDIAPKNRNELLSIIANLRAQDLSTKEIATYMTQAGIDAAFAKWILQRIQA